MRVESTRGRTTAWVCAGAEAILADPRLEASAGEAAIAAWDVLEAVIPLIDEWAKGLQREAKDAG